MKIEVQQIGFDFDGVIADTGEAFIRLACEEYDFCSFKLTDITSFQVEKCLDIPASLIDEIFQNILLDSLGSGLKPMEGSIEVLCQMTDKAPVTIITARSLEQPVTDWLDYYFPPEIKKHINLVAMGDHDDKARHIHDCGLQYFVDDRSETCRQIHAADIHPFVFSQPWNRGKHSFSTVESWQEIAKIVGLTTGI